MTSDTTAHLDFLTIVDLVRRDVLEADLRGRREYVEVEDEAAFEVEGRPFLGGGGG